MTSSAERKTTYGVPDALFEAESKPRLPNGRQVDLKAPTLRRLVVEEQPLDVDVIAALCLDYSGLRLQDLDESGRLFVACWALEQVAKTGEGLALTFTCSRFSCLPSEYLDFADRNLAFEFDLAMAHNMIED
jgi:hypothetical protein